MNNILIQGRITLRVHHKKGGTQIFELTNQITNQMRTLVFDMLTNSSFTPNRISEIGFGTGTTSASASDTGLQTEIARKPLADFNLTTNSLELFFEELSYDDNNGETITEYGLFTTDGSMVARKLDAPIVKNNLVKIEAIWTISFL